MSTMEDEEQPVGLEFTFRYSANPDHLALRSLALGMQPMILVEPSAADEGFNFNIDCTDLEPESLATLFELFAAQLREHMDNVKEVDEA